MMVQLLMTTLIGWIGGSPAYAALTPEEIVKTGFACDKLPSHKLDSQQMKTLGRVATEVEVCSDLKSLTDSELNQINQSGRVIMYVTDTSKSLLELQELARRGTEFRITDEQIKSSNLAIKRWAELARIQPRGRMKVFVTSGKLDMSEMGELARAGAQIHVISEKTPQPYQVWTDLAPTATGGLYLYTKVDQYPEWQFLQLRTSGVQLKITE